MVSAFLSIAFRMADLLGRAGIRRFRDRHPLKVRIEDNPNAGAWSLVLEQPFPIDRQPSHWASQSPPPSPVEIREWLLANGAIDYRTTVARLFLRGAASQPVRVRDIRVRILNRMPTVTQTLVVSPMAGSQTAVLLMFDLDTDDPLAYEGRLDGAKERVGSNPYFHVHNDTLRAGESLEYRIDATAATTFVDWMIDVEYELDGRIGVIPVNSPRGGWFRTSGGDRLAFAERWMCGVASFETTFRPADPTLGE
jgi:hypothetical protein